MDKTFNDIWLLNPEGNRKDAEHVCTYITKNEHDERGYLWEMEALYKKYKAFLEWWDHKYRNTESRFVPAEDKKRDIYTFFNGVKWMKVFRVEESPRDKYFMGEYSSEYLAQKTAKFLYKMKNHGTELPEQLETRIVEKEAKIPGDDLPF